jgi:MFS family permease
LAALALDTNSPYRANIRRYYAYAAVRGLAFGMIVPIWVIYLQRQRGLSFAQITLIDAVYWLTQTLAEVPTGVVADTYGRKISLLCGGALVGIAMAMWTQVATLPLLFLTYVIWGVGQTFFSGAEDALLYESMKATGQVEGYAKVTGRVGAISIGMSAVGNVVSGPLATIDLALPIVLCALMLVITLGITLTFKEPPGESRRGREGVRQYTTIVRDSLALIRALPSLRYAIFYMTLLPAIFFIVHIYFLQPQSLALGVPLVALGVVALAVQIANMLGMARADWLRKYLGERRVLYFAPLLLILCLVALGVIQLLPALSFIVLIGFVSGVVRPLILSVVQNQVGDDIRATILSMQSLINTLFQASVVPALGLIADRAGLPFVYFVLAGILGTFLWWLVARGRAYFPRLIAKP